METTLNSQEKLVAELVSLYPADAASILNQSATSEIIEYLSAYPLVVSKEILFALNTDVVSRVLVEMEDGLFQNLFPEIDPYRGALLMSRLPKEVVQAKLKKLTEKQAKEIYELLSYPLETAGFLMDTQITTFNPDSTVEDALETLRSLRNSKVNNLYVAKNDGSFLGKIPIQLLAISEVDIKLNNLVEPSASVSSMAHKDEVVELFEEGNIFSLPVVDADNRILGVIRHESLVSTAKQDASEDALAMFGAGREERALSTAMFAVKKRLPWLQINLATAFLAASIVGIFEDTIAQITVLAVFLPVVAGQSGNTGSQALAVTIRGLALREFRMDQWFKVAMKELTVGFVNGVAVAITTGAIVYFWADSFGLAAVIATSMVISMVIAGFSGAVIPIMLKSIGQDPAQSSSIVLTTVTDIVGFLSFLGLATLMISALGIT